MDVSSLYFSSILSFLWQNVGLLAIILEARAIINFGFIIHVKSVKKLDKEKLAQEVYKMKAELIYMNCSKHKSKK